MSTEPQHTEQALEALKQQLETLKTKEPKKYLEMLAEITAHVEAYNASLEKFIASPDEPPKPSA